jgi:predicted double-glycine peptidase
MRVTRTRGFTSHVTILLLPALVWVVWPWGRAPAAETTIEGEIVGETILAPGVEWGGHGLDSTSLHGSGRIRARSWRALRDAGVVRQTSDNSCGAAALATLLSGTGKPVTESEILAEVLAGLAEDETAHKMAGGLSFLDLQGVAEKLGYRAQAFPIAAEVLPMLTRPVVVYIRPRGYRHFAVLRGVRGNRVFLADPARGNVRYPIWRFLEMWRQPDGKGRIFIVGADTSVSPLLKLALEDPSQPEIMGARQLLSVGAASIGRPRME